MFFLSIRKKEKRRSGKDRRKPKDTKHTGSDRRSHADRRSGKDRRSETGRRGSIVLKLSDDQMKAVEALLDTLEFEGLRRK